MAKITGLPGSGKKPALTGNLIYQVDRGQLKVQSWPRKRGRPRSPITREQNEWFRQANLVAKYAPSDDQWMSIAVAKGSPWYPRDLLMSAMRGRLFEVLIIDGQEYRAMAINEDVSSDLDFLAGTIEGTIIVRGPSLWQGLVPGAAGEVLTSQGPADMPAWGAAAPGAGDWFTQNVVDTTPNATAQNTKGNAFYVVADVDLKAMGCRLTAVATDTYQGRVYTLDGSNRVIALVGGTAAITGLAAGAQGLFAAMTPPITLTPGNKYMIAWSTTNQGGAFVSPFFGAPAPREFPGFPEEFFKISLNLNHFTLCSFANPAPGDLATITPGGRFHAKYQLSF